MVSKDGAEAEDGSKPGPSAVYVVAGCVLLAVAAVVGHQALDLQLMTPLGPGAGFFPGILSALLALLSVLLIGQAMLRPDSLPRVSFGQASPGAVARISAVVVALFLVANLIEALGFRITIILFFVVMFAALGGQGLLRAVLLAVGLGIAYALLFGNLLGVPLPAGPLGF